MRIEVEQSKRRETRVFQSESRAAATGAQF